MDLPLLKLVFVKGPKEGETLEFKPGSTVRVGRIIRGNDIAIKDAGISTKHLRICSDSGKWIIQDLGSSNGTALNSNPIPADTPFDLCHGDTIKLGEYTSIQVNFSSDPQGNGAEEVQEHKLPPRPRRNDKSRAVLDSDPVGSLQENPTRSGRPSKQVNEIRKENGDLEELPRRSRALRNKILEEIAVDTKVLEKKDENKGGCRVRRTRKKHISNNSCVVENIVGTTGMAEQEGIQEEKETKGKSRARRYMKTESTQSLCLDSAKLESEGITEEAEVLEGRVGKRVTRRGTRAKNIEIAATEAPVIVPEEKRGERVNLRITRSKKNEIAGDPNLELEKMEKEGKERRRLRNKMEMKPLGSDGKMVIKDKENNHEEEDARKSVTKSVKNMKVDLEKMTLGEWFDFLEVYLPLQMREETEKMIEAMLNKHKRVHEHIAEQKKMMRKWPVGKIMNPHLLTW